MDIRGLLNKVVPTNEDVMVEFCNFRVHSDEKMLTEVVELIFDKAVDDPQYCCMYADLCKDQVISERSLSNEQSDLFRMAIIKKFEKQATCKGIITLIAQLYRHSMLQDLVIHYCIMELLRLRRSLEEEGYIELVVYFLKIVGPYMTFIEVLILKRKEPMIRKKKRDTWTKKQNKKETKLKAVSTKHWRARRRKPKIWKKSFLLSSLRVKLRWRSYKYLILNLLDSRRNNWKQQLEKRGIKTINESSPRS
uniref:MIF4G domain-containing protein n=1 Tax=Ditylenchus dipsaci TaxID=166011 RepID=A0A915E027_9BILA